MANWDLIGAVADAGAGLMNTLGARKQAELKDELKRKLQLEDEARKDAKERSKPTSTKMITDGDGVMWEQPVNAWNDPVGEKRLPSKTTIDEINHQQATRKLGLEQAAINVRKGENDLLDREELGPLKADRIRSQIQLDRDRGSAALINANKPRTSSRGGSDEEPSKRDYIEEVKKLGKDLAKEYGVSGLEFDGLSELAVNRAIIDKIDPITALKQILMERGKSEEEE